ncbi:hypothetical protein HPB50_017223 [Hyalomma asiaticum]|uniref:Uncharacterized protein n=1 Tax=Hyalomma asiaticum TaxID=266040 RepID=A0ACB7TJC2_HYAAI|nr:hypothetical protein HPB50_017223 [Hyalomma asiaticum]
MKRPTDVDMFMALEMIAAAWIATSPAVITNCFTHAGLVTPQASCADPAEPEEGSPVGALDDGDSAVPPSLTSAWGELCAVANEIPDGLSVHEFVCADEGVVVHEEVTDEAIVSSVCEAGDPDEQRPEQPEKTTSPQDKTCTHSLKESFLSQIEKLQTAGYPEVEILRACHKLIRAEEVREEVGTPIESMTEGTGSFTEEIGASVCQSMDVAASAPLLAVARWTLRDGAATNKIAQRPPKHRLTLSCNLCSLRLRPCTCFVFIPSLVTSTTATAFYETNGTPVSYNGLSTEVASSTIICCRLVLRHRGMTGAHLQKVTGILTFALSYSSRVYVYQLSKLVVRVEPEPSIIYVIFVSFLYWFVSLLVLVSSLLSNTGINVTSTLFYVLLQAFGLVFYLSGGISLLALEAGQSVATAAGVFAVISAVLHGLHALFVYLKRKK